MFTYCPACASGKIGFSKNVFRCPDCGFVFYQNTAAATGCLITVPSVGFGQQDKEKLLFTVRQKDPGKGLLDLPGGFVDPGEGLLEGLYRELNEELGWVPPIPKGKNLIHVFKLFASFPNVYSYKGFDYNTCDMYFSVSAQGLSLKDLHIDTAEVSEVRLIKPGEIDFNRFAFESTKRAVKAYLKI